MDHRKAPSANVLHSTLHRLFYYENEAVSWEESRDDGRQNHRVAAQAPSKYGRAKSRCDRVRQLKQRISL